MSQETATHSPTQFFGIEERMPPPNLLLFVKRKNGAIYLGYRIDKPLSTNPDASRDCYWYGNPIIDSLAIENRELKIKNNFSDVTVESWAFIKP